MTKKTLCTQCGIEFTYKTNKHMYCTTCKAAYDKQRRENYNSFYKDYLKDIGCLACGFNNPNALEVHHLCKGSKRFAKNGNRGQSLFYNQQDIEAGLAIVLCANCHLIFHSYWGGRRATFPDQTKQSTVEIINNSRRVTS